MDLISSVPAVVELARVWFAFNFSEPDALQKLLAKNWFLDHTPLLLKPWHPMFDASRERIDEVLVWVRLHGLPLHCWMEDQFHSIRNLMGTYL